MNEYRPTRRSSPLATAREIYRDPALRLRDVPPRFWWRRLRAWLRALVGGG